MAAATLLVVGALAGCGANASVETVIGPGGAGIITWTAVDSPSDISGNGHLTVHEATAILKRNAPPGSTVTGPVRTSQGNDRWTVTDHFKNLKGLDRILLYAVGAGQYQPVTMQASGPPWAVTYRVNDPDSGTGAEWNWLTSALNAKDGNAGTQWMNGGSADTVFVPWSVPKGQPTLAQVSSTAGAAPSFGVTWVPANYRVSLTTGLGARTVLTGTWAMTIGAATWKALSESERRAINEWWRTNAPHASGATKDGARTWTAAVVLHPGADKPWGTLSTFTESMASTFWERDRVTGVTFTPSGSWVLPGAWTTTGLTSSRGWTGPVNWSTKWAAPFGGSVKTEQSLWDVAPAWQGSSTWQEPRWGHVFGAAAMIAVLLLLTGGFVLLRRRYSSAQTRCTACGALNLVRRGICSRCGQPLAALGETTSALSTE